MYMSVDTETVCILKIYFIGFFFFHYNLVTSDDIGLEFHRFEMPTLVLQWCIHV